MIPGCYNKQRPDGTCLAGTHLCLQADRRGWKRTEKNQLSTLRKVFCICCVLLRPGICTLPITVLRVQSIRQRRGKNGNYERMSAPNQKKPYTPTEDLHMLRVQFARIIHLSNSYFKHTVGSRDITYSVYLPACTLLFALIAHD